MTYKQCQTCGKYPFCRKCDNINDNCSEKCEEFKKRGECKIEKIEG